MQIFRTGTESEPTVPNDVMLGSPVTKNVRVGAVHGRRSLSIHIADWPSGVYFAQLTAPGARSVAPFVLAPRHLGEHRVAVVMPTQTWQAYNFRDDNGDGQPDTWYAGWKKLQARLIRPFLDRGVPPHWKQYDAPYVPRRDAHAPQRRLPVRRRVAQRAQRQDARRRVFADRVLRAPRVRDHPTSTTSSAATAISAATSPSSPRTTSSGRSRSRTTS